MTANVRLFLTGFKPNDITLLQSGFKNASGYEMIIAIEKPNDAERNINRQALNVLLIDLDHLALELTTVNAMRLRHGANFIFASNSRTRASAFSRGGSDDVAVKPAILTEFSAGNFISLVHKAVEGFLKKTATPNYRELNRLVGNSPSSASKKIVAIASSTGGTNALEAILKDLPPSAPPLVVVQHMPSGFTKLFADRINAIFRMEIKEARTGDYLKQGLMLLAPADQHMKIVRRSGMLAVECFTGVKIHGVMPAADVLFESIAEHVKNNAIGVILTGMGADGAKGLMLMRKAGASTIGQNKETCVVYGMPKVAKDLGAVETELPIGMIADKIMSLA